MSKESFVIHPFLFALFPVFFLLSHNIYQASVVEAVVPALVVFAVSLLLYGILCSVFKNKGKAGIVTSVFFILFFSFGHVKAVFDNIPINAFDLGRDRYVLFLLFILFIVVLSVAVKAQKDTYNLTKILNAVSIVLVSMSLLNIVFYKTYVGITRKSVDRASTVALQDGDYKPNIYYIILDGYTSADVLKNVYGFDNSNFMNFLQDKGFFIARDSNSNYSWTFLSLASSLNMKHVNYLADTLGRDSVDRAAVFPIVEDNEVQRLLKLNGYKFLHVSSNLHRLTNSNKNADVNFAAGKFDEFPRAFIQTTALYPFIRDRIAADKREGILYSFDALSRVADLPGPRFTFAHIIMPHPDFVFGRNGEVIADYSKNIPSGFNTWKLKDKYIDQVIFTNKKTEELVNVILEKEMFSPIIIIQGDHGSASEGEGPNGMSEMNDALIKERTKILNAYYFPPSDNTLLYDSITPVNSFRVVFDQYFGLNLPLLPDTTYFSEQERQFNFIDVTDVASASY